MIIDILCNRKFNWIVTELFNRDRKLDISIVLITQSYFPMPKNTRWNFIDFNEFMNLYKKCTEKPFSSLVIDATFAWDNFSRFKKNLPERK